MPNYGIPQEMFFTTLKEEERERGRPLKKWINSSNKKTGEGLRPPLYLLMIMMMMTVSWSYFFITFGILLIIFPEFLRSYIYNYTGIFKKHSVINMAVLICMLVAVYISILSSLEKLRLIMKNKLPIHYTVKSVRIQYLKLITIF
jgi:hypothetical protein